MALRGDAPPKTKPETTTDKHIVDVLIEERAKTFSGLVLRLPLLGRLLRNVLLYQDAKLLADQISDSSGEGVFDYLVHRLDLDVDFSGLENVPAVGAAVVVANHPTGLADGVAIWQALRLVRKDVVFFANADALRVNSRLAEVVIPIEWRIGQRSPSRSRVALVEAQKAIREGKCLVIFPSGIPAVPTPIFVKEQPWLPTFVSIAGRAGAPIVPIGITARNSRLFYLFCMVNKPLRHMSLFREFLNKKGATFRLVAHPPVMVHSRPPNQAQIVENLRALLAGPEHS